LTKRIDFRNIQRLQHRTIGSDTLIDDETLVTWHEGSRQHDIEIILFEAALSAHLDDITEALGRDEGGAGAASLDQRIGRKCRAMNNRIDLGKIYAGHLRHLADTPDDRIFRIGIIGQDFDRMERDAYLHRNVGEGATDIDTDPDLFAIFRHFLTHAP